VLFVCKKRRLAWDCHICFAIKTYPGLHILTGVVVMVFSSAPIDTYVQLIILSHIIIITKVST